MLELKNISLVVTNTENKKQVTKKILDDVSLKIGDNDFVVVTGPNGSGKSSLAKVIMGIIKPTSGTILFNGKDITNLSITERSKLGIGFAFQQPVRFKGLTVKDLIEASCGDKVDIGTACKYLSDVGLCAREYVTRDIDEKLSGGELKRIEIAILEAKKPKLSIFDEPEAGIDLWSFNNLISLFKRMQEENKSSHIIISHQERIINIADTVVLLEEGKVSKIGKPEDVISSIYPANPCKKVVGEE